MTLAGACLRGLAPLFLFFHLAVGVYAQAFGRFGRIHEDGLLTLNVNPRGVSFPATTFNSVIKWGDPQAPLSAIVPHIDPTEKRLAITGGGDGAPQSIRYSLLYPGVAATFGTRMVLRFETRDGKPLRCGLDATRLHSVGLLLLPGDRFPTAPLLIVPPRRNDLKVWFNGAALTIESATPLGEVRIATPTGIARVKDLGEAWSAARAIATVPVPERIGSKAALSADRSSVTITETFRGGVAPVSPVLAFALAQGYPAQVDGALVRTAAITRWGPFAYIRGGSARVTLPVPPNRARGYVVPSNVDSGRRKQLNALVDRLSPKSARNAVDLMYTGVASAQLAGPFLSPPRRKALADAWQSALKRGLTLSEPIWHVESEPITGESYLWTRRTDGPGDLRADTDRGNALPLYGLATYARYSGDWESVRRSVPTIRRIRRYFDLADDWVWMTAGGSDQGRGTGIGDSLGSVYAAAVACRDMAQAVGDRGLEEKAAVWAARVAVPTVARLWYTEFARRTGQIGPASVALGFHETEGFTRCVPGKDDPWNSTSLISADGCLPELAELYARYATEAVRAYEDAFETAFPRWFDPAVGYPFATAYKGNSLFVAMPHVYLRAAALGESEGKLWPRVDRAMGNREGGWISPNVFAELMARSSPLRVTGWGTARYDEGDADGDGSGARLRFVAPKGVFHLEAELAAGIGVSQVTVAGAVAPHAVEGRRLSVSAPVTGGRVDVVVVFERQPVALPASVEHGKVP